jgi:type I restriction enzyme S subunit
MKPYHAYKPSGIDWIGDIPEHWEVKKLKMISNKVGDGLHGTPEYVDKSDFYFVNGNNIKNGNIEITEQTKCVHKDEYYKNTKALSLNTILISINGTIGNLAYYGNEQIMLGKSVGYIDLQNNINKHYVFFYLSSNIATNLFEIELSGSTIKNLSLNTIDNLSIPFPSFLEQTSIANYLDRKTSEMDTLIANKQRLIELLKEERMAIINQAVTKGINPNLRLKPSGIEWIGDIPEHWEVKPLKYLGKIVSGNSFKSEDFIDSGECRVMKISNIQTMKIDWSDESFLPNHFYEQFPNFQIKRGDLVFALTRPIISTGIKASIVDCDDKILLNQRNAVLKPKETLVAMWMYYIIFNSRFIDFFDMLIDKTGQQPNISSLDIANISIPLPTLSEQNEIVNFLDQKTTEIDTIISKTEKEIELMKEYKTALISEVVTGKVDVREYNLN